MTSTTADNARLHHVRTTSMLDESFADWTANGKMASEVAKRSQVGAWASRWEECGSTGCASEDEKQSQKCRRGAARMYSVRSLNCWLPRTSRSKMADP